MHHEQKCHCSTHQRSEKIVRIGLLSDTHGYWDNRYAEFFASCDEIWHAGDIGSLALYQQLQALKPVRAVVGNIDGYPLRQMLPVVHVFEIEKVRVLLTHIGGYPKKYAPGIVQQLRTHHTTLFISGHSHILKVMFDPTLHLLHINPGAAGRQGFQQVRTLVRFVIDQDKIKELEIKEIPLNE